MEENTQDALNMGLTIALCALLCSVVVAFTWLSKHIYAQEEAYEGMKEDISIKASLLEMAEAADSRDGKKKEVTGDDIIEFILKQGPLYSYTINIPGQAPAIISIATEAAMEASNLDGTIIWTENYLANEIFKADISNTFLVTAVYESEDIVAFIFNKK